MRAWAVFKAVIGISPRFNSAEDPDQPPEGGIEMYTVTPDDGEHDPIVGTVPDEWHLNPNEFAVLLPGRNGEMIRSFHAAAVNQLHYSGGVVYVPGWLAKRAAYRGQCLFEVKSTDPKVESPTWRFSSPHTAIQMLVEKRKDRMR